MRLKRVRQKGNRFLEYLIFKIRAKGYKKKYRSALVVFNNIVVPRRLYQVCTLLLNSDYTVYVKIGMRDYLRFNYIGKLIFRNEHIFMVKRDLPITDLLVTDADYKAGLRPEQKVVHIDYNFFPPNYEFFRNNCYFPIMFHPRLMSKSKYKYAYQLSQNKQRKIRVLFAGNLDPSRYDSNLIKEQFGVNTRAEVIGWITNSTLLDTNVYQPSSFEQFLHDMQHDNLKDKIVIINTMECEIPQHIWLDILAKVDFFIMVPGLTHPFCHNMAESMSTGAIPIVQYPQFFYPVLEDGKNCYSFSKKSALEELLKVLVTQSMDNTVEKMRQSVVEYHENYLSLNGFKQCLEAFVSSDRRSIRLIMARRLSQ